MNGTMSQDETVYVVLISAEGHEFYVERKIAMGGSGTIKAMLEGTFRESNENLIRFPAISGLILERVVRYLHYKTQNKHSNARIPEFNIEPEVALELMIAAKFLDC